MTSQEIKTKYPEAAAEIAKEAVTAERDRADAYLEYADVDMESVKLGIQSGKNPTQKFFAEMNKKSMSKEGLANMEKESAAPVKNDEAKPEQTADQRMVAAAEAELDNYFNIK